MGVRDVPALETQAVQTHCEQPNHTAKHQPLAVIVTNSQAFCVIPGDMECGFLTAKTIKKRRAHLFVHSCRQSQGIWKL